MQTLSFPVWVMVNIKENLSERPPFHLLRLGGPECGEETEMPARTPVFTSKEIAEKVFKARNPSPFVPLETNEKHFYRLLSHFTDIEDIIIDMGTPQATVVRVEQLLVNKAIEPEDDSTFWRLWPNDDR